MSSSSGF